MYIEELVHEYDRNPSNATLVPKVGAQLYSLGQMAPSKRPARIICTCSTKYVLYLSSGSWKYVGRLIASFNVADM